MTVSPPRRGADRSVAAAVVLLVLMAIGLSLFAGPALNYTDLASAYLADPDIYVRAVLGGVELVPNDVVQIQGGLGAGAEAGGNGGLTAAGP